jgi:peptide/nickel transport system permease protein
MTTHTADAVVEELEAAGQAPVSVQRGWYSWIFRRLAFGVVVLFVVSLVVFGATQALPTDPAQAILGKNATPESLARLREQLGLNRSIPAQYADWAGGVVTGDLGSSLAGGRYAEADVGLTAATPVSKLLIPRLQNSLSLLLIAALISIPFSILLGAITAIRRDRGFDKGVLLVSLGMTARPEFVVGMALAILFATTVWQALPAVTVIPPGESPFAHLTELALPVITLVIAVVPYLYRLVRASMIDVLESEYVAMARLKGMPDRIVTMRHALPNAMIPAIQASGLILVYLLGGIVVVEFLFRYPGIGSLLTDAITNRDLPVVQATCLVFAAGVVLFNLLADVLTVLVTPKLRTAASRH